MKALLFILFIPFIAFSQDPSTYISPKQIGGAADSGSLMLSQSSGRGTWGNKTTKPVSVKSLSTNTIAADTSAQADYEIDIFPDLQNMVRYNPVPARAMFNWVVANKTTENIQAVLQVGDLTDWNTVKEYDTVSSMFNLLDATGMPYMAVIGNHDYGNGFNPAGRDAGRYLTYFGNSRYSAKPWYNYAYQGSTENYSIKFDAGAKKYFVLGLEFLPRDGVVTWASNLLDSVYAADPLREVIVVTHSYIAFTGELATDTSVGSGIDYGMTADNSGQELWDKLIKKKANIRFVFNGHHLIPATNANRGLTDKIIAKGDNGNLITQIFVNYQDDGLGTIQERGYIMRLKFRPSKGTIDVSYYSPFLNEYDSRVEAFTLEYPNVAMLSSLAVKGITSTGELRIAGETKIEALRKGGVMFSGSDHLVKDTSILRYDESKGTLIAKKFSTGNTPIPGNNLTVAGSETVQLTYAKPNNGTNTVKHYTSGGADITSLTPTFSITDISSEEWWVNNSNSQPQFLMNMRARYMGGNTGRLEWGFLNGAGQFFTRFGIVGQTTVGEPFHVKYFGDVKFDGGKVVVGSSDNGSGNRFQVAGNIQATDTIKATRFFYNNGTELLPGGTAAETDPLSVRLTGNQTASGTKTWNGVADFNNTINFNWIANFNGGTIFSEASDVATPGANKGALFARTDGKLWYKNSTGAEYDLTSSGGSYTLPIASASVLGGVKVDGTTITADGSGVISANLPTIAEGEYTPTISGLSNASSVSVQKAQYLRVGNTVTVFGTLSFTSNTTYASFQLSVPFSSNFQSGYDGAGTFTSALASMAGSISISPTNGTMVFDSTSPFSGAKTVTFHMTYKITPG